MTALPPGPQAPPSARKSVWTFVRTFVMTVVGIILLLPGVCAVFFMSSFDDDFLLMLVLVWIPCFLIAAGGVWIIMSAFRRLKR